MTYNPNFQWKRKTITITTVTALTAGHQVKLAIPKETEMQSDFRDLRFETTDGYGLPYWLETIVSNTATVWVKLKNAVDASTVIDIYMYYGNPYVTSLSNGTNTFDFFDDFEDGNYTGKFQKSQGTLTETGGYIQYLPINSFYSSATAVYTIGASNSWKVRTKIQKTDNALRDMAFGQVGTESAGNGSSKKIVISSGTTNLLLSTYDTTINNTTLSPTVTSLSMYTSPLIFEINKRTGSVTAKVFNEGGSELGSITSTTQIPDFTNNIGIYGANPAGQYFRLYWMFIGKYIDTEPATPTIGSTATNVNWNPQRKTITINTTTATPANYQVKLTIPFAPEMNIDFSDLRFVSKTNVPLDYWIESSTPGVIADIWVKLVDSIGANSSDYIYMHYSNPYVTSLSNGTNTFDFFDDFEDGNYTGKFQKSQGTLTETGGYIQYLPINSFYSSATAVYTIGASNSWKVRTKIQKTDNALRDMAFGQVGTESAGNYLSKKIVIHSSTTNLFLSTYDTARNDTTLSPTVTSLSMYTSPLIFEINKRTGSVTAKVFNEGGSELGSITSTTQIPDFTNNIGIYGANPAGQYFRLYWMFIGKYIDTEPTFSIGTAESMNSFSYRKTLTINNGSGNALIDYQVPITVAHVSTHMQSNFNDIRFVDVNGNLLPYWIESKTDNSTANVWIKVNLSTGNNTVYLYYGNSTITSASDINTTFIRIIGSATEQPVNGAWTLNNNVLDTSGNSYNGTLYGGMVYTAGKFGQAGLFDGSNDYIHVSSTALIDGGTQATYEAWVYPLSEPPDGSYTAILVAGDDTQPSWYAAQGRILYFNIAGATTSKFYFDCGTDNANTMRSRYTTNSYAPNQWYHVVVTFNSGTINFYINGVSDDGTAAGSGTSINTNANNTFSIGANVRTGQTYMSGFFNGKIDEVRMYNRMLTPAEITDLYNNYGYTTTNYPGRELVRKYSLSEPTYTTGAEEQSTGTLDISSTPSGAEIFIDTVDQSVTTPRVITGLTPGSHNYELTLLGYVSHTDTFTITSGSTTTISVTLVTPAHITATNLIITPSETPCRHNICTVRVDVTWTNNGGSSGTFVPNITIDTIAIDPAHYPSQELASGASIIKTFIITGLATGTRNICPYPN